MADQPSTEEATWLIQGKRYDTDASAREAVARLFWVTYRSGLVRLAGSSWTTDAGWGCMVRSAQMMLAHAWQRALCGSSWSELSRQPENQPCHDLIVRWFTDHPLPWHSFGVHHITQRGIAYGMTPGEWYGPHKVAVVLRDLLAVQMRSCDGFMASAVAADSTVYIDQIHELCADERKVSASHPLLPAASSTQVAREPISRSDSLAGWDDAAVSSSPVIAHDTDSEKSPPAEPACAREAPDIPWLSSLFLQVPLRLGLGGRIDVRYWPALRRLFSLVPQCLGMVGGTPSHSLFFVGITPADKLIYLDPHTTQATPRFKQGVSPSGQSLSAPASARSIAASSLCGYPAAASSPASEPSRADDAVSSGPSSSSSSSEAAAVAVAVAAAAAAAAASTVPSPPEPPTSASKANKQPLQASDSLPTAPPLTAATRSHSEPIPKHQATSAAVAAASTPSPDADDAGTWTSWLDSWTLEQHPLGEGDRDSQTLVGTSASVAVSGSGPPDAPPPPLRAALATRAWDLTRDDWASVAHSKSFHFRSAWLRTTPPTRIDPSLTVGFFCRDAADFAEMQKRIAIAFHGRDAPFAIEATTPAWMLERTPSSPAVASASSGGIPAACRYERAVPTYRDAFGLAPLPATPAAAKPPLPSPCSTTAAAVASTASADLPSDDHLHPVESADLASWVHVQPEITLDDESGFLVVNHG